MDPRLLEYYNRELLYLRELGGEFAEAYPKVAGRLGMHGVEVADPYVERLLEGFSFLSARIQLKMDAEFPRFSQRLLEVVYPNYLAPVPAMGVAQLMPSPAEGNLASGFELPRATALRAAQAPGEQTPCEFRTAQSVTLWPIRVMEARVTGVPADLPLARVGLSGRQAGLKGAVRIRLEVTGGVRLADLALDRLTFFLNGQDADMSRLMELILGHTRAVLFNGVARPVSGLRRLPADSVRHEGFDDDQALLPVSARAFQGYRLLQEYLAFPARTLFFSVGGLAPALRALAEQSPGDSQFELTLLLDQHDAELENTVQAKHFLLFCTPVVNLFPKQADRVAVTPRNHEFHLVVDRTRPLDYEVHSVTGVLGHSSLERREQEFQPFYGSFGAMGDDSGAYYSMRREPRVLSDGARRHGTRTGYTGSEVHLSLVDQKEAPYAEHLRHLSVDTLCTNRDLALLMPHGTNSDFSLKISAPVASIKLVKGVSRPAPALAENAISWSLISHLGLNHLTLTDLDPEHGAAALRELLLIHAHAAGPSMQRQIAGLRRTQVQAVYRRLPVAGPILFGRGVSIGLQVDEAAFSGFSPYMLGAVLEQFFARHVSINMVSELTLDTLQRGRVAAWPARAGRRPAA